MKKMIKIWDIILVSLLGLLALGCRRTILEPPPAEYGPPPDYDEVPTWIIENEGD